MAWRAAGHLHRRLGGGGEEVEVWGVRRGQQAPGGFLWEAQALEERSYHMLRKEREKGA